MAISVRQDATLYIALYLSTLPTVAEGFQLRTWRTGPHAGRPKVPPADLTLIHRGVMRPDGTLQPPRLLFTEAGIAALRQMMAVPWLADPTQFAHIRRELGIDAAPTPERPALRH